MRTDLKDTVAHRRAALVVAENAVKTQEQWLRRLVASLPDVAWTSTEDGRTIFMSPNVESIFGYPVDELCNSGEVLWFQTIHPDDRRRVIANYRALFSHGRKFDEEFRAQSKDGHWIWVFALRELQSRVRLSTNCQARLPSLPIQKTRSRLELQTGSAY